MPKRCSERELTAQRVASALGAGQWGMATMGLGGDSLPLKTVDYLRTPPGTSTVRLRVMFYEGKKFGMNVTVKFTALNNGDLICRGCGTVLDRGFGNPGGYGGHTRTYIQRTNGYFGPYDSNN